MYKLRELERTDLTKLNQWRNQDELILFLGAPFRFINEEVDYKWFDNYMNSRSTCVRCAIIDESGEFIGIVSLTNIDSLNQSAEFHIMIGNKDAQSKGAGTFATKAILEHAFMNLNIQRIYLSVLEYNVKAIKLYEKVGFIKEGTMRHAIFKNGKFVDMHLYSILRSEFFFNAQEY